MCIRMITVVFKFPDEINFQLRIDKNSIVRDLYINGHLPPNVLLYIQGRSNYVCKGEQLLNNQTYFCLETPDPVVRRTLSIEDVYSFLQVDKNQLLTMNNVFRIGHPIFLTNACLQSITNKLKNELGLKVLICDSPQQLMNVKKLTKKIIQVKWLFTFPPCDERNYNKCQILWGMIPGKDGKMKHRNIINSRYEIKINGEIVIPSGAAKHKRIELEFGGPSTQILLHMKILKASMNFHDEHSNITKLLNQMSESELGHISLEKIY
jgi:hypothetical protein